MIGVGVGLDGRPRARARLGLALGAGSIFAVRGPGSGGALVALEAPLRSRPRPDGEWPELAEALRGLLDELGLGRATADVALLPPLSRAKCVDVPPIAPAQLDALVRRNLRRYFAVPYPAPLGRARATGQRSGKVVRALVACADAAAVAAVCRAAEAAGVELASMTAGPVALVDGLARGEGRAKGRVVATWRARGWAGGLEILDGVPQRLEDWGALPAEDAAARTAALCASAEDDERPARSVVLVGHAECGGAAAADVGGRADGSPDRDPWILAARGASARGHRAPSLLPGAHTAALERSARRRARGLAAAAAVVVALAVAVHSWGLGRELAAVESARALLAPQVSRALEVRRAAYAIDDRLRAVDQIERDTPRWTPALAALSQVLPRSTYLVSLNTEGLSLRLGGVSRSTEGIVPELQASPLFQDVTMTNVRASGSPGSPGTEFDLSMALRGGDEAPAGVDGR